jgi:hypothetical protein
MNNVEAVRCILKLKPKYFHKEAVHVVDNLADHHYGMPLVGALLNRSEHLQSMEQLLILPMAMTARLWMRHA